tara:strand:- start:363 stop:1214 length:852 start_codon:yes stop_codon:yes gene_type:complete
LIWGFTAILGALISVDAIPLVWHRMWMAALFIFLFLIATKRTDFNIDKQAWKIILAGVLIAAHWITFFHSIKISNVSVTLACVSTGAFFGSLIEPIVYWRKIDFTEILLGLLVVGGLYLIFRFEGDYTTGIIVALISAFLAACFSVLNSKLVKGNTPFRITFLEMIGGWLAISAFAIYGLASGSIQLSQFALSGMDWVYLIVLGSICTAYAFIESVTVMKHLSSYTVLLTTNLEPIYGILLALIIFGDSEKMNPYFYVGAAIILSTVVMDALIKRRRKKKLVV